MESFENLPTIFYILSVAIFAIVFASRKSLNRLLDGLSVKLRLTLIGFLSVFSLASIILNESFFMNKINEEISAIAERDLPLIEKMTKAEFAVMEGNIFFEKSINMRLLQNSEKSLKYFNESDSSLLKAEELIKKTIDSIKEYLTLSISKAEIEEFEYVISGLEKVNSDLLQNHKEKKQFIQVSTEFSNEKLVDNIERIDSKAIQIERDLEEILIHFEKFTEKSAHKAEKLETFALNMALAIGLLMLTTLISLITLIAQGMSRPISNEAKSLQNITKPSLSLSHDCLRLSNDLHHSSSEQATAVTQTAASCEEISQTLEVNLRQAENSKLVAEKATNAVDTTLNAMDSLMNSIENLKQSNENMNEFVTIVETIKEKTAVIDEIVFQTKLLSFNASVEAERAGEHGRGFAVVASEVGHLASTSGKASVEISGLIKDSTSKVKDTITVNKKNMESAMTKLKDVLSEGNNLKKDIDALSDSNASIATASKEQTEGVRQVNTAILSIQNHSDKVSKYAQELSAISNEIVGNSNQLDLSSKVLAKIAFGNKEDEGSIKKEPSKKKENIVKVNFKSETKKIEKKAVGQDFRNHDSKDGWENI